MESWAPFIPSVAGPPLVLPNQGEKPYPPWRFEFADFLGFKLYPSDVLPDDFVEQWLPTEGFFSDDAGTTPQTNNGGNVNCWTGVNGTKMLQRHASFIPTLVLNGVATGRSAIRLDSKLTASNNLSAQIDKRDCTFIFVYARRLTTTVPVVNLYSTAGDFSSAVLFLQNGYQRPETDNLGSGTQCELGTPLTGFNVLGFRSDAAEFQWCINGRMSRLSAAAISSGTFPAFGLGTIQGVLSGGDVARVIVYDYAMSPSQLRSAVTAVAAEEGITQPARVHNIIFTGDSITRGANSVYNSCSSVAAAAAGVSAYDWRNWGQDGAGAAELQARDAPLWAGWYDASVAGNVAVMWGLTNSLAANISPATALASQAQWVADARAAGFVTVVPTVINRTSLFSGGQDAAGFATAQATTNTALTTNAGGIYADVIVDLDPVKTAGTAGDGTHPIQVGHTDIGGLEGAGITTALGM